jgi:uncharacterized protein YebE (UPF0316 family)
VQVDLIVITSLATLSVSLWTVRVAVTAAGHRLAAAAVAVLEAVVFVAAFSRVADRLDSPGALGAYAVGVGLGTLLGLVGHARLNWSQSQVEIVAPASCATELVGGLRRRGWSPATVTTGDGWSSPVVLASVTVDDHRLGALLAEIDRLAPDAYWTVRPVRSTTGPNN